jgi:hypothetical protein
MQTWKDATNWEAEWHGNCINSYWEETKQLVYAKKMGLKPEMINGKYPVYNMNGVSVLDVGGGAYSMLLKCVNVTGVVIDPCDYPSWVYKRYEEAGIKVYKEMGETKLDIQVDECWVYNCLQHTKNPEMVIKNVLSYCKILRLFEWIENGISEGHLHNLKEKELNKWLGGYGKVDDLNENGCVGKCYNGIFKGDRYV